VLNFSHPLTPANIGELEALLGVPVDRVLDLAGQLDPAEPFAAQVRRLFDRARLGRAEWQTLPLVVHLPGLSAAAALVLAELHGRTGSFPPVLRLRRVDALNRYEVAEVVELQAIREAARWTRATPAEEPSDPARTEAGGA
jgi:hypothetical protein